MSDVESSSGGPLRLERDTGFVALGGLSDDGMSGSGATSLDDRNITRRQVRHRHHPGEVHQVGRIPSSGQSVRRRQLPPTPTSSSHRLPPVVPVSVLDAIRRSDSAAIVSSRRPSHTQLVNTGSRQQSTTVNQLSDLVTSSPAAASHRALPTIKLGSYSGDSPLETFLCKLDNCKEYYHWSERDVLCHLKASLDGDAGQVLWEIDQSATKDDIIRLLRNRFGNINQAERFRAELKGRKRKRGESVQHLYQDVKRLVALGYPGQAGPLCELIALDAILDSLNDPTLRVRVLEKEPLTIDAALAIVCRL